VTLSLKLKLSLLITGLVTIAVFLVGFSLLSRQEEALTEAVKKRGLTIAANLAAGGKSALVTNDDLALNILVKEAMRDGDLAYVAFADDNNVVHAHSDVTQMGKPMARPAELKAADDQLLIQTYRAGKDEIIDFAVPLVFSKTAVGTLYVGFNTQAITAAVSRARNQAAVITAVMILLGVAGAVALSTVLSRPIFRLVKATEEVAAGRFEVSVRVTSRDELGMLTESFNRMVRSLREGVMIKSAFARYVAREVAEEIFKDPEHADSLRGERSEVTVLFCDIRGFTSLSERLTPEEVVSLLNDFYTLMIEATTKHDGILDKFLGDAVMAVFGAPILPHADHARRAVLTALDMRNAVAGLSQRRAAAGKESIDVGIGVSLGEVVAGTVGTEKRVEYTVIGDSVNVAARLVSQAKPGTIQLSRRTYDAVKDLVDAKPLGATKVRGKEEEVEVYEVRGLCAQR
jgi:adenylate cyclase